MNKRRMFSSAGVLALLIFIIQGCSFSTANMSDLQVYKTKDGKDATTNFTAGDTIYAKATISNNPGKVKVNFSLADPKGQPLKGTDVSVDLEGSNNIATYSLPIPATAPAGSYKLNADMINENGEKKDGKSINLTIAAGAKPTEMEKTDKDDADTEEN